MFAKRDVFALLLSCFAVYYSTLSEGVVSFHPAFVVARDGVPGDTAWDAPGFAGRFAGGSDVDDPTDARNARKRDDHPPPPRFFDLNGDGVREMLVATGGGDSGNEPQLKMVEMAREDIGGNAGSERRRRRARLKNSYSRATEDVLSGERNRGSAAFFGSADTFERARVLARTSLLPKETESLGSGVSFFSRAPIAIGVGAVRPATNASSAAPKSAAAKSRQKTAPAPKKGVVVVVTEGWHVLCFDHNLKVMWEKTLGTDFPRHAKPREAAVLVTTAALFEGDRGLVIVGGRVERGVIDEESDVFGSFDPLNAELEREHAVRTHAGGERMSRDDEKASFSERRARHFNYYAFETGTGEVRWVHESDDFHRDVRGLADALVPQHDHKLDAAAREAAEGRHFGEAACRDFRESVVQSATPHCWTGREDTRFALSRFEHHKRTPERGSGKESASFVAPQTKKVKGTHGTPFQDGDDASYLSLYGELVSPNVFVAHQEEGIEVVHLFGGRTLCKMLLTPLDAHADVNGDGVLEHVSARGGGGFGLNAAGESFLDENGGKTKHHDRNCWARVSAGTPPRGVVFEGSICRGSMGVTRHKRRDGGGADDAAAGGFISGNTVDVASPVALRQPLEFRREREKAKKKAVSVRSGVDSTGDGTSQRRGSQNQNRVFPSTNPVFDLVFLNSRGEMTSYTHEGVRRWQQRTDSGWAMSSGETPSFFSFPLRSKTSRRDVSESEVALAVGATRATFVTPSGYVLATLKLPARPIAPVLIEDVNGDGLNDVVLRTERGVFAWTQKSRVGAKPFSVLAGALCVLVGGTLVAQVAHARLTGMKRLVRSTEMDESFEGRKDR